MSPGRFNRRMQRELDTLLREGVIGADRHAILSARYPVERWDWRSLGRWFLIFGIISAVAGVGILAHELFQFTLKKLAVVLGVLTAGAFAASWRLRLRNLHWAPRAAELGGGLLLIGLTFTLGYIYSTGSGNWPALLLIDLALLLPLAYALNNVLLLILTLVVFFTWFGGVTGYVSGWGAYFFGMNYPLRFAVAGAVIALFGFGHRQAETGPLARYQGFFLVWLSGGVFFAEMALWLLSLFGNFGDIHSYHRSTAAELWLFNLLWAGVNGLLLWLGGRFRLRMLRGYAITFLIIQGYTQYFWHVAPAFGVVLGTFIAGAIAFGLLRWFERSRSDGPGSRQGTGSGTADQP